MPVMALVSPSSCIISCCPLSGIGAARETILVQNHLLTIMTMMMNDNDYDNYIIDKTRNRLRVASESGKGMKMKVLK